MRSTSPMSHVLIWFSDRSWCGADIATVLNMTQIMIGDTVLTYVPSLARWTSDTTYYYLKLGYTFEIAEAQGLFSQWSIHEGLEIPKELVSSSDDEDTGEE